MADNSSAGGGRGGGRGGRTPKPKIPPTKQARPASEAPAHIAPPSQPDNTDKPQDHKARKIDSAVYLTSVTPADIKDDFCRTFIFKNEGHTLGNSLRFVIANYPEVTFVGHTIPHPSENEMHMRIQTNGVSPVEILRRGLHDLEEACEHTETLFKSTMQEWLDNPDNKLYDPTEFEFKMPFPADFSRPKLEHPEWKRYPGWEEDYAIEMEAAQAKAAEEAAAAAEAYAIKQAEYAIEDAAWQAENAKPKKEERWILVDPSYSPPPFVYVPPTSTEVAPTSTEVAPTSTEVAPTSTEVAPTSTEVAPMSTAVAPASTAVPAEEKAEKVD